MSLGIKRGKEGMLAHHGHRFYRPDRFSGHHTAEKQGFIYCFERCSLTARAPLVAIQAHLKRVSGVELSRVNGFGVSLAQTVIMECGTDSPAPTLGAV